MQKSINLRKNLRKSGARLLILASKSPWRKRLLWRNGIACKIHVSHFKERKMLLSGQTPRNLVLYNARGKALEVAKHYKNGLIVGVDTIVVFGKKIITKPKNRLDAKNMLIFLSGKTHRVISGLCLLDIASGKKSEAVDITKVTFKKITSKLLEKYLRTYQWKGKAGSYAIQGAAKSFVKKIEGDITNVVGLPVKVLKRMLDGL